MRKVDRRWKGREHARRKNKFLFPRAELYSTGVILYKHALSHAASLALKPLALVEII